jgi:hypothetical protein
MGQEKKGYRVLVGKTEGKRTFEDQGVEGGMRSEWLLGRLNL